MNRRSLTLGAAGVAAAAVGAGWQVVRGQRADDEIGDLWTLRFPQPDGGELVMAERRGKPLLLNFWATWCPPCVKEMPALDRFQRRFGGQGWQVVGLAIDGPTPVREYLRRVKVGFAIGLAGLEGTDLSRRLGNTQGALPFTAVFDARGRLVQRKLGETSDEELLRWAAAL
jgi:thiol-disulfide isomerase/thioredoxin